MVGDEGGDTNERPAGRSSSLTTVMFTDIEGSTRLWESAPEAMAAALSRHDEVVGGAITERGGSIFANGGDGFGAVFAEPDRAVEAARAIQAAVRNEQWPGGAVLRVRIGIHVGPAEQRDGNWFGSGINACARITETGHGGQVLLSAGAAALAGVTDTTDLGEHPLRGIEHPVRIVQLGSERFEALRGVAQDRTNLPSIPTELIGRDDEIARIRALLVSSPLVTMTGVGGCGKTHLAVAVAAAERPSRDAGVYFVDLTPIAADVEVPTVVAAALRLQATATPTARVLEFLADKNALVVLDNCEHVIEGAAAFASAFLAAGGPARLLATSRELLDVHGEQVVPIGSLDADGDDSAAEQLLVARARASDPTFDPSGHRAALREVCRRLDGMPLAIELAAARLAVMSPEELEARLDDRFRLLAGGRRGNRTRTLEATLRWSYDLLDAEEQRVFRCLGVFPSSFGLAAAASVARLDELVMLDIVEALVAKSLVTVDRSTNRTRYRMLETVRAFAQEELHRRGESEAAREAHLDHCSGWWAEQQSHIHPPMWLVREAAADFDNLRLAAEWAVASDDIDGLVRLVGPIAAGALASGFSAMGREWVGRAVAHVDADTFEGGVLRLADATMAAVLDDWPATLALRAQLTDHPHPAIAVTAMAETAFSLWALGRLGDGQALLERATAREADAGGTEAAPLLAWVRASFAIATGDLAAARALFAAGVPSRPTPDDATVFQMFDLVSTAMLDVIAGDPDAALRALEGYDWSVEAILAEEIVRVMVHLARGEPAAARALALAYAHKCALGRTARMSNDALLGLAAVLLDRGDAEAVRTMVLEAGIPRSPHTVALAKHLSREVGIADEYDAVCDELRSTMQRPDARRALLHWIDVVEVGAAH